MPIQYSHNELGQRQGGMLRSVSRWNADDRRAASSAGKDAIAAAIVAVDLGDGHDLGRGVVPRPLERPARSPAVPGSAPPASRSYMPFALA